MKCPSCNSKIGIIKNSKFLIQLYFRTVSSCPYCSANIFKKPHPTWGYFESIFYVMLWFGIVLFLLAIIYSRHIGFKSAIVMCFWSWLVVVVVFFSIIILNLLLICFQKIYAIAKERMNE